MAADGGKVPRDPGLTPEQQDLVRSALPILYTCADEIAYRYHPLVTAEELLAPGLVALQQAARAYHPDRHPRFPRYAKHHVRGRMIDAVRVDQFSLRARVERAMDRAYDVLEAHHVVDADMFDGTDEEILEGARKGGDEVLAAAVVAAAVEAQRAGSEEQLVQAIALHEGLATLYPHEREILQRVYELGMSVDEAAADLHVHPNTAQRRHASGLRKLRAFFGVYAKDDG